MTTIQACQTVRDTKTCHLVRPRKGIHGYDVKPTFTGNKRGWIYLDLFSASAVCLVADAVNAKNRAKLDRLPIQKAVSVCFKLCK